MLLLVIADVLDEPEFYKRDVVSQRVQRLASGVAVARLHPLGGLVAEIPSNTQSHRPEGRRDGVGIGV